MPSLDVVHLTRNRCGVYCFRLRSGSLDQRVSLGTKCPLTAHIMAARINAAVQAARTRERGMTSKNPRLDELSIDLAAIRKYKIDPLTGAVETNGTREDHEAAMEMIDRIGVIPGGWPKTPPEVLAALASAARSAAPNAYPPACAPAEPSKTLAEVVDAWLAERERKNGPRTVYAKQGHYRNFAVFLSSLVDMATFDKDELAAFKSRRQAEAKAKAQAEGKAFRKMPDDLLDGLYVATKTPLASLSKQHIVGFKEAMLKAGDAKKNSKRDQELTAKTVDNKLLSLSDFFAFAIGNGAYKPEGGKNPVSGTFILTKQERQAKADRYKPFTPDDLAAMFDPLAYKAAMGAEPDLYWCPLIALFTGMRISEATGIHCEDVSKSPNGVDIVFVRKSKTGAGVRDVPIAQALIDLGFLDFVAAQRAAGHERLFPDRLLINHSYSKDLSDAFREHLIAVGVRKLADKSERKSFHSFRANVITQFRVRNVPIEKSMRIVGHSTGMSSSMQTHLGYVHELPDLKDVVDLLEWPIDLIGLRLYNNT